MEQSLMVVLSVVTALVSLTALVLTIRRDGKTDKKERDETRDMLTGIKFKLDALIKSNDDIVRAACRSNDTIGNHESRLVRLETRVFPAEDWRPHHEHDDRKGE